MCDLYDTGGISGLPHSSVSLNNFDRIKNCYFYGGVPVLVSDCMGVPGSDMHYTG